jgi:hypothetical protein
MGVGAPGTTPDDAPLALEPAAAWRALPGTGS